MALLIVTPDVQNETKRSAFLCWRSSLHHKYFVLFWKCSEEIECDLFFVLHANIWLWQSGWLVPLWFQISVLTAEAVRSTKYQRQRANSQLTGTETFKKTSTESVLLTRRAKKSVLKICLLIQTKKIVSNPSSFRWSFSAETWRHVLWIMQSNRSSVSGNKMLNVNFLNVTVSGDEACTDHPEASQPKASEGLLCRN